MRTVRPIVLAIMIGLVWAHGSGGDEPRIGPSGHPVPRFESLRFNEVNGRLGPSFEHPVEWIYSQAGLPVMIVMETEHWRKIRDPVGDETWVHRRVLSARRTVYVRQAGGAMAGLYAEPSIDSPLVAYAEPGAVLALGACYGGWCQVSSGRYAGWTPAGSLWGSMDAAPSEPPLMAETS